MNFVPALIASNDGDRTKVIAGNLSFAGDDENAMVALRVLQRLKLIGEIEIMGADGKLAGA
ncbi:hypothetical protein [Paenibacillus spongiae]|uniref:Uncharacterized protein n=1 Tax=Paenibacillus spongiae TaxID=2909671 RepID=A0ABY5SIT3_9BACL|nr:hypothetical protein [Paenibacillus spongiae]UVI33488.1 hypothetical protein L1F29_17320 [Paenibacillus spongiae]